MIASLSNLLLHVLAASASISFVAAQSQFNANQFVAKISSTAAPPGYNVQGGTVFDNFVNALNDGQLFLIRVKSNVYEKPESEPAEFVALDWCSDLTFSDLTMASNSSLIGYAGRCVSMRLAGYAAQMAAGAQSTFQYSEGNSDFGATEGISAVFVEQLNAFEGQIHINTDDWVARYWDDGRKTMPRIDWEGHDEGDMSPKAATSSFSSFGEMTWMSVDEVAQLLNTSVGEFTPDKFKQVYEETWVKGHEYEAAENNPNAEAEQEIIEQVKNETDSTGETATPAQPDTEGDGGTDAANPVEEEDSASGRKLTSVAARFVSAALRVFGI